MKKLLGIALSFGLATAQAQVSDEYKNRLAQEMKQIAGIYANQYAPRDWKERHLSWNIQAELDKALAQITNSNSAQDYRKALGDFVKSTQDYHVSVRFFSTERASVPFLVRTFEGKTLIVDINKQKLTKESFPFSVGDELLSVDGKPIGTLLTELMTEMGKNVESTDLAIADIYVTNRSGRANLSVPRGPVTFTIKRAKETTPVSHQLVWEYQKEEVPGATSSQNYFESFDKAKIEWPEMKSYDAADLSGLDTNWGIGEKTSFIPALGEKIWQSADDSIFDAYIYLNEAGKLVGVIRIPSYMPQDADAAIKEMTALVEKMEKQTSALVIDQVNNPGGSVFYLYSLVSLFIKDTAATPQHKMALNESRVMNTFNILNLVKSVQNDADAKKVLGPSLSGYPVSYQMVVNIRDYCRFILDQWQSGKKLTDPYFILGVDKINPNPKVSYSKPIVLLVNELDFSGGDFFPAILQDNKRVTVVGTRTAGAGGYVNPIQVPNSFGFEVITLTGSLAERIDRNPIENLGVTPDVELKVTTADVRGQFSEYTKKVKSVVDSLIK